MRAILLASFVTVSAPAWSESAPDWVARGSGEHADAAQGQSFVFGVGSVTGVRNKALAAAAADHRARAELKRLLEPTLGAAAGKIAEDAKILDHWRSEDGSMYSLVRYQRDSGQGAAAAGPAVQKLAASILGANAVRHAPAPAGAPATAPAPAPAYTPAPPPANALSPARSDVDTPSYKRPESPDDFALVIGAERYALGLPDADYAERDAAAVREHLLALGYPPRNVVLLTGARASRAGLSKNIEAWLRRNVNERSNVFFYYSGHGAPDPRTGDAYLVPTDGDPQYLEETAYPLKRLYEKLAALKAKRVVVALDSCFSGSGGRSVLAKGTRPLVGKVKLGYAGEGKVVALSASDASEISGALEEQGHGLFTYFLLKGLNGAAADPQGRVTAKSLHAYLTPKVQDEAQRQNREQTPQLTGGDALLR